MVTLQHPHMPKVTREVEPKQVADWVAQGWIDKSPKPKPKPGPKKPPRSATTR